MCLKGQNISHFNYSFFFLKKIGQTPKKETKLKIHPKDNQPLLDYHSERRKITNYIKNNNKNDMVAKEKTSTSNYYKFLKVRH